MKKLFLYAAVAALTMSAASCQKESLSENGANDALVFTASIDGGMDTKTILTSEKKVNWETNDEITVNGVVYTATPGTDEATKADFTKKNSGDTDPTGTYNAFYPSGIQNGATAGGTLPAEQTYVSGKITNVPMFATSTTKSLSFKNICAVLAVTVKNGDFPSVKSIKVSSSDKAMSGAFTVSDDGQTAVLTNATTVANTVTLNCGATAVSTASEGTVFYIAIPPQTYQNLKIELSDDGSNYTKAMTTKKDADIIVTANTVYPVTFKADQSVIYETTFQDWENVDKSSTSELSVEKKTNDNQTLTFYLMETIVSNNGTDTKFTSSCITPGFLKAAKSATTYIKTSALKSITSVTFVHAATGANRGYGLKVKGDGDTDWVTLSDAVASPQAGQEVTVSVNRKNVQLWFFNLTSNQYAFMTSLSIE